MLDIILAVCCIIVGFFSGIKFAEKYTEKFKFYKSICFFNEQLYDEVVFFKNGIPSLKKNDYLSIKFMKILNEYARGNSISELLPTFLNVSQKNDISMYFENIGKSDVSTQKQLCVCYKNKFEHELQIAEDEQRKYSSLCKKTGIIVGLIIFIILF